MGNYEIKVGYLYNDSFSEKEFVDAVLKHILNDSNAPSYIFDEMTISEVSRINVPLILSTGDAIIEYFRKIGYDRVVTTTTVKTKTYANGFQNKSHSTSSKTYTDWEEDRGTIKGSATSGIYDEKYLAFDEYITNHKMDKNNISNLSNDALSKYTLSDENIEFLKNDIIKKVYANNITYPSNHVKDEEYSGDVTLYNTTVTIVSLYCIKVSVRDKVISYIASSNGDIEIKEFGEYPYDDYEDNLNKNIAITKERKEATRSKRRLTKITFLSSLALFIIFLILGISLDILALTIISIAIIVLGLIITFKFMYDVKIISRPYFKRIYENNINDYNEKKRTKEDGYLKFINSIN